MKKLVGDDFDVDVDVVNDVWFDDFNDFREGVKSDDFSGGDEKGKKGNFMGFGGLKKNGLKSNVVQVL